MWRRVSGLWPLAVVWRPLHLCPRPPRSKIQKCFSSSAGFCNRKDGSTISADSTTEKASENQKKATKETKREDLLNILHGMKIKRSRNKTLVFKNKLQVMEETKSPLECMKSASKIILEGEEHKKAESCEVVSPALVKAASAIASSLPCNRKQTRSDLLSQLRKHKTTRPQESGKASGARSELHKRMKLDIFQVAPRVTEGVSETDSSPTLWDLEYAKEIAALQQQPPLNGFEELIQWTKEGKLWEFPINNEAGIEDDVEFYEHIFLDKYLEDFPKRGPIRHFMELVTCGLSKNPYLTVKQKVEHIEWFQNYFKEKEELLKEIENYEKETEFSLEKKTLLK